jgi:hypothetical protein
MPVQMHSKSLHRSLSFDDRDRYDSESSDENLFYAEYLDAASLPPKAYSKYCHSMNSIDILH